MAGNYFHDPRPFYGLNHHNLISMDELFYGRREPPPWYMHQMPHARFDDQPARSRSMDFGRPEQYIQREDQFREYRRPGMQDDIYMDYQYGNMMHGANKGQQQQKNHNQGGNNGGNNNNNNNNNNTNNKGKKQQKHDNDSDEDDYDKNHKGGNNNHGNKSNNNHGNKSHNNDHGHNMGGHNNKSWSDNKGFHGGHGHGRHRRSLSLTQTVLKKLGLRDDSSSSDSSDDDRHGSRKNKKGGHGHMQIKADHKPYTVRFDDQFYGHSNQSNNKKGGGSEKLGEDHGSHGKKGGGQQQGILKTSKNKHGDDGYSSDEENRGHKNHGNGKGGNQQHGGAESGKKNGQAASKQLGRSQSMDFRVNLCCENCERKVRKALRKMDVDQVLCDQWNNKVMVTGNAKLESVLKKLRSVKKDTHLWHHLK